QATDTFQLNAALSGAIDGGGRPGLKKLEIAAQATVNGLNAGFITRLAGGFANVADFQSVGASAYVFKGGALRGLGSIEGRGDDQCIVPEDATFAGSLDGGGGSDRFLLDGQVLGSLDGGGDSAGTDILDLSDEAGPITVNLAHPDFAGVEEVIGNGVNSTLIG